MLWYDWLPATLALAGLLTAFTAVIRFFIKYHVRESMQDIRHELKPNSGSSMKDQVTRLESTQIKIQEEQTTYIEKHKQDDLKFERRMDKLEEKIDKVFDVILKHFGG